MKKELLKPALVVASVATLLTGCASMDRGYTMNDASGPVNALAYTTVTDPNQLVKWTGDRYLMLSLRSADVYYFQVPDTTSAPREVTFRETTTTPVPEAAGAPGPYQSETRSYRVIRYQPGMIQ